MGLDSAFDISSVSMSFVWFFLRALIAMFLFPYVDEVISCARLVISVAAFTSSPSMTPEPVLRVER